LQAFVERGYAAFGAMRGGADEFVSIIVARERAIADALFAGDDEALRRPAEPPRSAAPASNKEREAPAAFGATLQFDDPINIQFTSGTTGTPKGATLTHHNILNNGYFIGEAMRLTSDDRLCIPVPYYHCFGMVLGNLACVTHGSCMVSPAEGSIPWRRSRRLRPKAAPGSTACRRCSSPCSIIPSLSVSI
jgi:acyl-CoA synthetase (AMP-forming)/AMP-acid ligase II